MLIALVLQCAANVIEENASMERLEKCETDRVICSSRDY